MKINRRFTSAEGKDAFGMFKYEAYNCQMTNRETGAVIVDMPNCIMPMGWSINARNTVISKYFRKAGVPTARHCAEGYPQLPAWLCPQKAVGKETTGETDIREVIRRIVGHWTFTGYVEGYFDPDLDQLPHPISVGKKANPNKIIAALREENARAYFDEMCYIMLAQMGAPNSPQWFNTGLWWAYGIAGQPQGHYFVDLSADTRTSTYSLEAQNVATLSEAQDAIQKRTLLSPNAYQHVQAHACFIVGLHDHMLGTGGIMDWYDREARIFKFGSGSGTNLSNLRGANEPLSGGGVSSGPMPFFETADRNAGAIKSGGTTRRAACIRVMNLDHPDIEAFIGCKLEGELSVAAMVTGSTVVDMHCTSIVSCAHTVNGEAADAEDGKRLDDCIAAARAAGVPENYIRHAVLLGTQNLGWPHRLFTADFEGRAYQIAPFQNANISVRIPTSFYEQVDKNGAWKLIPRTPGGQIKTGMARALEDKLALATWFSGDPGVQFDTTINDWSPSQRDGHINASNPCGEYHHLDDTACNLASARLTKFIRDGKFQVDDYQHAVRLWTITLDITNAMCHLPDARTAINTYLYRNIGLGYADLGALLMAYGLPYGSGTGQAWAAMITALHQGQMFKTSAEMAKALGQYPRYDFNKSGHLRVLHNHMAATGLFQMGFDGLSVAPERIDHAAADDGVGDEEATAMREAVRRVWIDAEEMAKTHGLRNAQLSVIAPTGTIGIAMDCDTTGVEPLMGLLVHKKLVGGGKMTQRPSDSVKAALLRLGYGDKTDAILQYVAERGDIPVEGLYVVKPEHREVFQTAMGSPNVPALDWEFHVAMMAAVQPFISGGISKTVNMPESATVDDVKRAFRVACNSGVKSIAIYRYNCKLSQPLTVDQEDNNAALAKFLHLDKLPTVAPAVYRSSMTALDRQVTAQADGAFLSELNQQISAKQISPVTIAHRVRLGWDREPGFDVAVKLGPGTLYLRTTRYDDGKCAEIWANYTGASDIFQSLLSQLCRTANVALQYGVPLQAVLDSWKDSNFAPQGMVGDHPYIKTCRSVVNLSARLLAYHELGGTEGLNIQPADQAAMNPEQERVVSAAIVELAAVNRDSGAGAKLSGLTCPDCGSHQYVQSGAGCMKCLDCGFSGGCG